MDPRLRHFLEMSYTEQVMGGPMRSNELFTSYKSDPTFMSAAQQERDRLNGLGGRVDLAKRDFAAYQHLRALTRALEG